MDPVLIEAFRGMVVRFRCSADDILHDPDPRAEFLAEARRALGPDRPERELLNRLSALRKQSRLPRSRDVLSA